MVEVDLDVLPLADASNCWNEADCGVRADHPATSPSTRTGRQFVDFQALRTRHGRRHECEVHLMAISSGRIDSAEVDRFIGWRLLSCIHKRALVTFLHARPAVMWRVITVLSEYIRRKDEPFADLAFHDIPGRVARKLLQLAPSRGEAGFQGPPL